MRLWLRNSAGFGALPMLLLASCVLVLGQEVSQAVGIDRKVTLTSRTVADLASQVSTIASSGHQAEGDRLASSN